MKRLLLLAPALFCWFALFAETETYRVTARTLNVRSAPDKDARVVSSVPQGEILGSRNSSVTAGRVFHGRDRMPMSVLDI